MQRTWGVVRDHRVLLCSTPTPGTLLSISSRKSPIPTFSPWHRLPPLNRDTHHMFCSSGHSERMPMVTAAKTVKGTGTQQWVRLSPKLESLQPRPAGTLQLTVPQPGTPPRSDQIRGNVGRSWRCVLTSWKIFEQSCGQETEGLCNCWNMSAL